MANNISTDTTPKMTAVESVTNSQSAQELLDIQDALTPDPGTEDMYHMDESSPFSYSPGQLSKLINPKSPAAFYVLGGLDGLEKGLRTDRNAGLSTDEGRVSGSVQFEEVAAKGAPKYGAFGDAPPQPKKIDEKDPKAAKKAAKDKAVTQIPAATFKPTDLFYDRKHIFRDNRLPAKKTKSIFELAWTAYNDKVLILLTIAALISLALGLYQTFAPDRDPNEPKVDWIEGVAILVAIM
jgi:Ca2+-transporting ATPase